MALLPERGLRIDSVKIVTLFGRRKDFLARVSVPFLVNPFVGEKLLQVTSFKTIYNQYRLRRAINNVNCECTDVPPIGVSSQIIQNCQGSHMLAPYYFWGT